MDEIVGGKGGWRNTHKRKNVIGGDTSGNVVKKKWKLDNDRALLYNRSPSEPKERREKPKGPRKETPMIKRS